MPTWREYELPNSSPFSSAWRERVLLVDGVPQGTRAAGLGSAHEPVVDVVLARAPIRFDRACRVALHAGRRPPTRVCDSVPLWQPSACPS